MAIHRDVLSAECHEPKYITSAVIADHGKVLTPSSTVNNVCELVRLERADLSDAATIASTNTVQTLTSKRIQRRVVTLVDAATIAVNGDTTDLGIVTLAGNRTLGNPTGTPTDGDLLDIRVRQDAVAGRTLAYDTKYRFTAATAPTVTATANETSYLRFCYHLADDKWDCLSTALDLRTT